MSADPEESVMISQHRRNDRRRLRHAAGLDLVTLAEAMQARRIHILDTVETSINAIEVAPGDGRSPLRRQLHAIMEKMRRQSDDVHADALRSARAMEQALGEFPIPPDTKTPRRDDPARRW